jgi:hypothetical protein
MDSRVILAGAIVFATIIAAWVFRYQPYGYNKSEGHLRRTAGASKLTWASLPATRPVLGRRPTIDLQASSASASVLKGEPLTLIAVAANVPYFHVHGSNDAGELHGFLPRLQR